MIITHIPPGMFEKHRSKYWFYPEKNNQFHDLLLKHAGVIGSFHAGHHHTDSFKVVYDANGKYLCRYETGVSNSKKDITISQYEQQRTVLCCEASWRKQDYPLEFSKLNIFSMTLMSSSGYHKDLIAIMPLSNR